MSLDHMNPNSKFKSLNAFIFGGSASIGTMNAGFHLDGVLELTDEMIHQSAYHFNKNFNDIPIIGPKAWENDDFLNSIKAEDYDLMMANCPCSGLSQINRSASADSDTNIHFYRLFNMFKKAQPKAFIIENAPTLIKLGYPILMDLIKELGDDYKITLIRDYAGNHNVAMRRMRTLVVGWRKDVFDNKIPLLHMNKVAQKTIKDTIGDLYDKKIGEVPNHELVSYRGWQDMEHLFYLVPQKSTNHHYSSILLTVVDNYESLKEEITPKNLNTVLKAKEKLEQGKNLWDKSPCRSTDDVSAPSITSVTELIHPIHNRQWTIREYARLMGYPDDFVFYPDECPTEIVQTIAQGVPAEFVRYISEEVKAALSGERKMIEGSEDKVLSFQHHTKELYKAFDQDELLLFAEKDSKGKTIGLDADKTFNKLDK
ncbi:gp301 [Bacillus phage G]|uniref:DNA (cytosine-5-)-methyltransferase n=1 Tax=Bacillus phage G TaxID=2884420 RepID=G3MA42_9CAUD|nr:gp301 [Bacillus phage G]AEO93560.1 gp301 [Bacillus phage G]